MKKQIIAIGGGGFGRNNSSIKIEKYILNLSKKQIPNICFLPTASGDDNSYIVRFYNIFTRLKCNPSHIEFFKRTINLRKHILNQDIIFVGGGNTKSMLSVWNDWDMKNILFEAYNKGVIMSGVSAGAICWFTSGITDSWDNELKILPCLAFVKGVCCPHYDEEPSRIPYVKRIIQEKLITNCLSIEGGSAMHYINDQPYKNISFYDNKNSYNVYSKDNIIVEKPYQILQL